jgi:hypothetical protein
MWPVRLLCKEMRRAPAAYDMARYFVHAASALKLGFFTMELPVVSGKVSMGCANCDQALGNVSWKCKLFVAHQSILIDYSSLFTIEHIPVIVGRLVIPSGSCGCCASASARTSAASFPWASGGEVMARHHERETSRNPFTNSVSHTS